MSGHRLGYPLITQRPPDTHQRMIIDFANRHGAERARAFGARLVASGELHDADVAAALAGDPSV